jgi:hypothetical protein
MKYIITESKFNDIIKIYMKSTYGDIEMNVDDERGDEVIHFFSEKDIDENGYRKRIAYRNIYKTLWINYDFLERMIGLFGTDVGDAIKKYFEDTFDIEIDRVNIEF